MLKSHFQMFAAYNKWANEGLYAAADTLSDDQVNQHVGVFFGSLLGTLNHIVTTDKIWLRRVTGAGAHPDRLNATISADLSELRVIALEQADRLIAHIDSLDENQFDANFEYETLGGVKHQQLRRESLAHLLNHQTHHRCQATTCFTLLGVTPPSLDLLIFQRT